MEVRLVATNFGENPYLLPYLAVKVSTGRVRKNGLDYYLNKDDIEIQKKWFIMARDFPSVLEHVVFTFYIKDISRVCSHQLVRHRLCSFTQESNRYSDIVLKKMIDRIKELSGKENDVEACKWFKKKMERYDEKEVYNIVSIAYVFPRYVSPYHKPSLPEDRIYFIAKQYICATGHYFRLRELGFKREEARYVLPQALKTSILMTVNLRELIHIIKLRRDKKAQTEIYELADKLYNLVKEKIDILDKLM